MIDPSRFDKTNPAHGRPRRPKSSFYYEPATETIENLLRMRRIDVQYLKTPFFGSRRMAIGPAPEGGKVNRIDVTAAAFESLEGGNPTEQFIIEVLRSTLAVRHVGPGQDQHPRLADMVPSELCGEWWSSPVRD